jgi:hypothetical protein
MFANFMLVSGILAVGIFVPPLFLDRIAWSKKQE